MAKPLAHNPPSNRTAEDNQLTARPLTGEKGKPAQESSTTAYKDDLDTPFRLNYKGDPDALQPMNAAPPEIAPIIPAKDTTLDDTSSPTEEVSQKKTILPQDVAHTASQNKTQEPITSPEETTEQKQEETLESVTQNVATTQTNNATDTAEDNTSNEDSNSMMESSFSSSDSTDGEETAKQIAVQAQKNSPEANIEGGTTTPNLAPQGKEKEGKQSNATIQSPEGMPAGDAQIVQQDAENKKAVAPELTAEQELKTEDLHITSSSPYAGTQKLLAGIKSTYQQFKDKFVNSYKEKQLSIFSHVSTEQENLLHKGTQIEGRIRASFAQSREQVLAKILQSKTEIAAYKEVQQGSLKSSEANLLAKANQSFIDGEQTVRNNTQGHADQPIKIANKAALNLTNNVNDSVNQAHQVGRDKGKSNDAESNVRDAKREASRKISADTAGKIAAGNNDAASKIRQTGPMTSQEFLKQGQAVASQLGQGKSSVDQELNKVFTNATMGLQTIEQSASGSLAQSQEQILSQLNSLEIQIISSLQQNIEKKRADIAQAGQEVIQLYNEQTQNALTLGDQQIIFKLQEVAVSEVTEGQAGESQQQAASEIEDGFIELFQNIELGEQSSITQLSTQTGQIHQQLDSIEMNAQSQLRGFNNTVLVNIDQSKGNIFTQLTGATNNATLGGEQIISSVSTNLLTQIETIDNNFLKGLDDYSSNLDKNVQEGTQEAKAPLADLGSRIDTGKQKAGDRAKKNWFERQLSDAWEMLSDPGFWAGLIVGLILTVVLVLLIAGTALTGGALLLVLAAGFAVIGAIAGVIGSIVSQASGGTFAGLGEWNWSKVDWGQVGMAALLGAGAGAIFAVVAFAAVEILGVTVGGLAFIGIMAVTGGVVGIISNLISGQPWDKGLLANMALAGLFAWLMKFLPGGKGQRGKGTASEESQLKPQVKNKGSIQEEVPNRKSNTRITELEESNNGKLRTGSEKGKETTPETIKTGEVEMELHPGYDSILSEIKGNGFEIRPTNGDPHVMVREVINLEGNLIRTEKAVYLRDRMRYIDLEHELGHVRQLVERFGEKMPPSERKVEYPDGRIKESNIQDNILNVWKNAIVEYHNRLVEYLRLHERGVSKELLDEHATGVEKWQAEAWKATKKGKSKSKVAWKNEHFSDIRTLESEYRSARQNLTEK